MVRFLFATIGYLATGTVIAALVGLAWLLNSERLTDEKMFRIMALIHDVEVENATTILPEERSREVLPEEASVEERDKQRQVFDRNVEIKLFALQRGQQEFNHLLSRLKEKTERFDQLALEWQQRLRQEGELSTQESVSNVVRNLQIMPEESAKDDLMRMMQESRFADVIMLMNSMSPSKLGKILKRFKTEDELNNLHKIHTLMLEGFPDKEQLDQALKSLESLETDRASGGNGDA